MRMHLPQLKRAESRFAREVRDLERSDRHRRRAAIRFVLERAARMAEIRLSPQTWKYRVQVSERLQHRVFLSSSCSLLSLVCWFYDSSKPNKTKRVSRAAFRSVEHPRLLSPV